MYSTSIDINNSGTICYIFNTNNFNDKWNHYAYVYENNKFKIYINGESSKIETINVVNQLSNIFKLISANSNLTIINNNIINKPTTSDLGWTNYTVYSQQSYTGSAYLKYKILQTSLYVMIGLTKTPNGTNNYSDIEYTIYTQQSNLEVRYFGSYDTGTFNTSRFGTVTIGDIFEIIYDGFSVNYYKNGEYFHTSVHKPLQNETYYLRANLSSSYSGDVAEILEFSENKNTNITFNGTINSNSYVFNSKILHMSSNIEIDNNFNVKKINGINGSYDYSNIYSVDSFKNGIYLKFELIDIEYSENEFIIAFDDDRINCFSNLINTKYSLNIIGPKLIFKNYNLELIEQVINNTDIIELHYQDTNVYLYKNNLLIYTLKNQEKSQELYFTSTLKDYNNNFRIISLSENKTIEQLSDIVEIPEYLSPQLAGSDFTIEFWAKINSITGFDTIFKQGNNADHQLIQIYMNSTNIYLNFNSGQAEFNHTSLNINNWNHFAFVYDSSGESNNGSAVCYFNGIQQNTFYWNDANTHLPGMKGQTNASGNIILGNYPGYSVNFDGELKQLKIWSKILTNKEIFESMNFIYELDSNIIYNSITYDNNIIDSIYSNNCYITNNYEISKQLGINNNWDGNFYTNVDYSGGIYLKFKLLTDTPIGIQIGFKLPQDNFTLINANGNTYIENNYPKLGISNEGWVNAHIYSQQSYTGNCYVKFRHIGGTYMVGLTTNPTNPSGSTNTSNHYFNQDEPLIFLTSSLIYGSSTHSHKINYNTGISTNTNDIFEIIYSQTTVLYKQNGVVVRSDNVSLNKTYYLVIHPLTVNAKMLEILNFSSIYNSGFYFNEDNNSLLISDSINITNTGLLYNDSDIYELIYDGVSIKYIQNNNILSIKYINQTNLYLNLDSSIYKFCGNAIQILELRQMEKTYFNGIINSNSYEFYKSNINTFSLNSNDANTSINDNIITKIAGGHSWNAHVNSNQKYTGSAYIKFKILHTNTNHTFIGLTTNSSINDYQNINYSLYCDDGVLRRYENGVRQHTNTIEFNYSINDIFEIIYENTTIAFYNNGNLYKSITVDANLSFYLGISLFHQNSNPSVEILEFSKKQTLTFNNYLIIPQSLSPNLIQSDFTIEFWAKINSIDTENAIYYQGINDDHKSIMILINSDDISLNFVAGRANFNHTTLNIINSWNHFAFIYDSTGFNNFGSVTFYFNGIQQTTIYWNDENTHLPGMKGQTSASGSITIGKNLRNNTYFNGELKELRVFNIIKYNSNFDVNNLIYSTNIDSNTLLYIPMNENDSNIYTNKRVNSNVYDVINNPKDNFELYFPMNSNENKIYKKNSDKLGDNSYVNNITILILEIIVLKVVLKK